ncbi:DoxX family protein [Photorhabdus luminescens]|uniref:DoxX family protein n=1 Tax=Photorhabdus akhurstii TaxID=171438 RepID=UPI000CF91025|nr:DoxX family protein [Photorhabdus luminescens]PQQ34041.1 DoxX family protein [Photorhabdus luminescens]
MQQIISEKVVLYFSRFALATAFLSAVVDRFGWWGNMGELGVSWGTMNNFYIHVAKLCPWAPEGFLPIVGWGVTILEFTLGITLLLGIKPKLTALVTTVLLLIFAISMATFHSPKLMLNFSVLTCAACAMFLYLGSTKEQL